MTDRIGFAGLGNMGRPMAGCLARSGARPLLWARNPKSAEGLADLGGEFIPDIDAFCSSCHTIFVMLANEDALDAVLGRNTGDFAARLSGRTLVQMGTTGPGYSRELARDIIKVGGHYVELPVSGSTGPAERGELVAMAAGPEAEIDRVAPLAAPMVSSIVRCGSVPKALQMKLAVNTYLGGVIGGLFEAFDFAEAHDLDLNTFSAILEAGPMSNALMRMKLPKLLNGDFSPQGSIRQAVNNFQMITEAGSEIGAPMPVSTALRALFERGEAQGLAQEDMTAITKLLRTDRGPDSARS